MQTLLPFTHIYMFDKGFAPEPRRLLWHCDMGYTVVGGCAEWG